MTVALSLWYLLCKDIGKFHFLLALGSKFIKKSRYRKNLCCFFLFSLENLENSRLTHNLYREMLKSRNKSFERWPTFLFLFFFFNGWICFRQPARKNAKNFASGLIVPGDLPDVWKNTTISQKWSHCNGLPAQCKNTRIFQIGHIVMGYEPMEKNTRIFQIGHIIMGYQPSGKIRGFFKSGHIVTGYLPRWYIVMGYLPRWSHCNGLPAQLVYCNGLPTQMVTL